MTLQHLRKQPSWYRENVQGVQGVHRRRQRPKENVMVLQNEIERCVVFLAKQFLSRNTEQLDPDTDRCLEIVNRGQRIGGEAQPRRILGVFEQASTQLRLQVTPHPKDPVDHSMRFQKYRTKGRALAALDAAGLDHFEKHLDERVDGLSVAVDRLTSSPLRFTLQVLHKSAADIRTAWCKIQDNFFGPHNLKTQSLHSLSTLRGVSFSSILTVAPTVSSCLIINFCR